MAFHLTPEEHDANPPSTWRIEKAGRIWRLTDKAGVVLETFRTKTAAELHRQHGFHFRLWHKEGRWFAGEEVPGWMPYKPLAAV